MYSFKTVCFRGWFVRCLHAVEAVKGFHAIYQAKANLHIPCLPLNHLMDIICCNHVHSLQSPHLKDNLKNRILQFYG